MSDWYDWYDWRSYLHSQAIRLNGYRPKDCWSQGRGKPDGAVP
jgi:hypothetical protein